MQPTVSDRRRAGLPSLGVAGFVLAMLGILVFLATFYVDLSNTGLAVPVAGDAFMLAGLICGIFGLRQARRQGQGWARVLTYVGLGFSIVGVFLYTGLVLFIVGQ